MSPSRSFNTRLASDSFALEAIAVEGYRDGTPTRDQVGQLLGLSFWDTEAFLKRRHALLQYHDEDLEQDHRDTDRVLRS